MRRAANLVLLALVLTGCTTSPAPMTNYIPPIPQEALDACLPPPFSLMVLQDKDIDAVVRLSNSAVAECEAKRRLLVKQWPVGKPK